MMQTNTVNICQSMTEVRENIDALDARIVDLMALRTGYVAQAARIKQHANQVLDLVRVEYIVARVRQMAESRGSSPEVVEAAYRALIGASIEFEHGEFARLRAGASA